MAAAGSGCVGKQDQQLLWGVGGQQTHLLARFAMMGFGPTLKWPEAGHVARRTDMRYSYRMLGWEPGSRGATRSVGRPGTRWEAGSIERYAVESGLNWKRLAQDRDPWKEQEDGFAAFQG